MKDIRGYEIKVGDTVKTEQYCGALLNPANPQTGIVIDCPEKFKPNHKNELFIVYKKMYQGEEINCYISLKGKINEILVK